MILNSSARFSSIICLMIFSHSRTAFKNCGQPSAPRIENTSLRLLAAMMPTLIPSVA